MQLWQDRLLIIMAAVTFLAVCLAFGLAFCDDVPKRQAVCSAENFISYLADDIDKAQKITIGSPILKDLKLSFKPETVSGSIVDYSKNWAKVRVFCADRANVRFYDVYLIKTDAWKVYSVRPCYPE